MEYSTYIYPLRPLEPAKALLKASGVGLVESLLESLKSFCKAQPTSPFVVGLLVRALFLLRQGHKGTKGNEHRLKYRVILLVFLSRSTSEQSRSSWRVSKIRARTTRDTYIMHELLQDPSSTTARSIDDPPPATIASNRLTG